MIRPIRRTVSVAAAAGLLAAGLTGCSLLGGGLGCSDLESAVVDHNLADASVATMNDVNMEDLKNLGQWMIDNGDAFSDDDLGAAVKTFGEALVPTIELNKEMQDVDYSDPDAMAEIEAKAADLEASVADLESAGNTIDEQCSGFSL
ncbi:MAG TPA: hypothetical protein H9881_07585 [Candidatus Stackebrandtia excrementipullorum]|nr:hypothetical protein [Candidatus Stackebrandtia excrementipullorum]